MNILLTYLTFNINKTYSIKVSSRLFISMEGTLYFAYNIREDDDRFKF
jgi:hypothetical protein